MEKKLILRGSLAGLLGGLLAFVFARIFAEPVIQKAIDYESARDDAQSALDKAAGLPVEAAGPDIFSRAIQRNAGIGVGMIVFGLAMGALVAVAYSLCLGRTGRLQARPLALLVAAAGFVVIFLAPFAKYPANPPAIGHEETIHTRGTLFLVMLATSLIAAVIMVRVGQILSLRFGNYTATVLAGLGYLAILVIAMALLPPLGHLRVNVYEYGRHATETPLPLTDATGKIVFPGFPADVLAEFRVYSVAAQLIMWSTIGLVFAPLADRVLNGKRAPQASAEPLLVPAAF